MLTFDPRRAYAHVERLASGIGARIAGSQADSEARAYARAELSKLTSVREQIFPILTGQVSSHALKLLPSETPIASAPFVMSGPGDVEGDIVWAGPGEAPAEARGAILFWRIGARDEILDRYAAMAALDPLAIVVVWPRAAPLPKHQRINETRRRLGPAPPSLAIRHEDGLWIESQQVKRARVSLAGDTLESMSGNIIGDIGVGAGRRVIVVGAHIDTAPGTPGAIDNAAGVACVLELARLWSMRETSCTLRFVALGAEKAGMVGAKHYLASLEPRELEEHALCICMDGFGAYYGTPVCYPSGCAALDALAAEACGDPSADVAMRQGFYGSDSEMFVRSGIPGIVFGQESESISVLHTEHDRPALVDQVQLARTGTAVDLLLQALNRSDVWPIENRVSEAQRNAAAARLAVMGWA